MQDQFFHLTCAKMVNDKPVMYVETVRVRHVGRCLFSAESDMFGRDERKFGDRVLAAMQLAYKACASVRKIEACA